MSGHGRSSNDRRRALRRGRFCEYVAAAWLMAKGYRLLAFRYRTRLGEIDLVMRKGDVVAFVEVKARAVEWQALDAVSASSQRRIRDAGDVFLSTRRDARNFAWRYDIVAVLPGRWPRHFRDAF